MRHTLISAFTACSLLFSCAAPEPEGLAPTPPGDGAAVRFDVYARPLPDMPLPNDIATRYDPTSPTGRRINASLVADTKWERATRRELDKLDGWGTFAPISVSFDKPLDVEVFFERHRDDYEPSNDAVYVVDISEGSPDYCQPVPLDLGAGNFPFTLERTAYFPNDTHNGDDTLVFEQNEEDRNGNGRLDPGEDLDMDGVLDHPNVRRPDAPGHAVDNLLTFYERETNTLMIRPIVALREKTRYAVVLTRRLVDEDGQPVRSPFPAINHAQQTAELRPLLPCLGQLGLGTADLAFTWSFSTQSLATDMVAVRDGLYGVGSLSWLADQFTPDVSRVFDMRRVEPGSGAVAKVVPGEQFLAMVDSVAELTGQDSNSPEIVAIKEGAKFIGYHVMFQFESPQFFRRVDADGNRLPLYDQVWDVDAHAGKAFTRPEKVTAWLTIPRPGLGPQPAPVAILGHGYTGNKMDPLIFGGFFARQGVATLGVECTSHGTGVSAETKELLRGLFAQAGLEGMGLAFLEDRAEDLNADGIKDSGADFWTAYVFHTRDVVRQSAVDYMQLVRVLRGFDGQRTWKYDVNGDGKPDLAGDFDGDGKVEVGGSASVHMIGGSLGGIMATLMGGLEPQLSTVVPISGGAGLGDIGIRSTQGGVVEAVNLRIFAPLLVSKQEQDGTLGLHQVLPDLNDTGDRRIATLPPGQLREGDTVVVRNHATGKYRCARVQAGELFRAAVACDEGDVLDLRFFRGPLPASTEDKAGCAVPADATPYLEVSAFDQEVKWQGKTFPAGNPLVALGDGFGVRRGSAEMRRFISIAQLALDAADPVNFAPNWHERTLRYGTGEVVRTRGVVSTSIGDMAVPASTGAAIARAAGLLEYRVKDPRWGKTPNQLLIDTGTMDATERIRRHVNGSEESVLMDIEDYASVPGTPDGYDVPRLSPPLRLVGEAPRVGGMSGAVFPFLVPRGAHGIDFPNPARPFDVGTFFINTMVRYLATDGRTWQLEACAEDNSCAWLPQLPVE